MSGGIGDIVAQLKEAISKIDQAAVMALRMRADYIEAHAAYQHAATGTRHDSIKHAEDASKYNSGKAKDLADNLAQAANALTDYVNHIAPGSAPARKASDGGMPSGGAIVSQAEGQGSKADVFIRRQTKNAENTKDTLEQAEKAVTDASKSIQAAWKAKHGPSGTASTSTPAQAPSTPEQRTDVENPVTAVVLAAGAVVIGSKALWDKAKKKRERGQEKDNGDQD